MFKILDYENFSEGLVEHLMNFTYEESTNEIFEDSYLQDVDENDKFEKSKAYEKFKSDYNEFIKAFMHNNQQQFIAVVEEDKKYISALRVIELEKDIWFEEALETAVNYRKCGYSTMLVTSLIEYLKDKNAKLIIANIGKSNIESINFHKKIGFEETDGMAVDEDGTEYPGCIRFEYRFTEERL